MNRVQVLVAENDNRRRSSYFGAVAGRVRCADSSLGHTNGKYHSLFRLHVRCLFQVIHDGRKAFQ
jgi:hypothetical protein